jgi:hypothetical protein
MANTKMGLQRRTETASIGGRGEPPRNAQPRSLVDAVFGQKEPNVKQYVGHFRGSYQFTVAQFAQLTINDCQGLGDDVSLKRFHYLYKLLHDAVHSAFVR